VAPNLKFATDGISAIASALRQSKECCRFSRKRWRNIVRVNLGLLDGSIDRPLPGCGEALSRREVSSCRRLGFPSSRALLSAIADFLGRASPASRDARRKPLNQGVYPST
jgi:hypothetical protein